MSDPSSSQSSKVVSYEVRGSYWNAEHQEKMKAIPAMSSIDLLRTHLVEFDAVQRDKHTIPELLRRTEYLGALKDEMDRRGVSTQIVLNTVEKK